MYSVQKFTFFCIVVLFLMACKKMTEKVVPVATPFALATYPTIFSLDTLRQYHHQPGVDTVYVQGYDSPNDGGQGNFYWSDTSIVQDNDGTVVKVNNLSAGRWKRIIQGSWNVQWFGTIPGKDTLILHLQNAINACALAGGGILQVPAGTYTLKQSSSINLLNNIILSGSSLASTILVSSLNTQYAGIFSANQQVNLGLSNLTIRGTSNAVSALKSIKSNRVRVENCIMQNCTIIESHTVTTDYNLVTESDICDSILVNNNTATGSSTQVGQAAILLAYSKNCTIKNNRISNYSEGIQWWGGDSDPDKNGSLTNPRWVNNVYISGNVVKTVKNGGIWGSMGTNITVVADSVENCGDVGIDFEGCFTGIAQNNYVFNCKNGCLATYNYNKNIQFLNNTVKSDIDGQYLFKINNEKANLSNKDITVSGNKFVNTGIGISPIGGDGCETLTISGNIFSNARINVGLTQVNQVAIGNNTFSFSSSQQAAFAAIYVQNITGSNEIHRIGRAEIIGNTIFSQVVQPDSSKGIYININDFSNVDTCLILTNSISQFKVDIIVKGGSDNTGIHQYFLIKGNTLGDAAYVRNDYIYTVPPYRRNIVIVQQNKINSITPYPQTRPITGYWDKGSNYYFSTSVNGKTRDSCITTGTPGTWMEF